MPEAPVAWFAALLGLPLAGALLAARCRGRLCDVFAVGASALTALVACAMVALHGIGGLRLALGGLPQVDRFAGHPVPLFGFVLDPLSAVMLLAVALLGFVCVLYSTAYVGPRNRELPVPNDRRRYFFWMLLFIASMAGLVTSATLFQLFLFWELTTLCSWALIGFYDREHGALEAAFKAFVMTAGGGLALFACVIALLALTGSADFDAFARLPGGLWSGAAALLLTLLLIGAWAKSGQVPFHTWLPDAMVAPSPVSAYLHAASMVNAGVYLVLRVVVEAQPVPSASLPGGTALVVGGMALVTLVASVAQFFFQTDLKRLLALSTISHLSIIMLGAALGVMGSVRAMQGASFHVLAHGVGKALLFLSVGTLSYAAGTRSIGRLSGVFRSAPVASIGFLIGALTVTGVPPFAGFWSKFWLISGAIQLGGSGTAAGVILLIESVVAFAWFLWVGQQVFLGRPSPAVNEMSAPAPVMDASLWVLMVLCLVITAAGLPLAQAIGVGFPGR